ncbi:hypothetical protein H4Q26_000482 [Puccinia striiformis f. sp. tritici PST-130]|nr:hypothetical protein H4Q26_000482 [Puccinia striiformis f. sp. tritici PST-130]
MSVRPIAFIDHHSSISADSKLISLLSSIVIHPKPSPGPADPDNHILTQVGAFYLGENVNHFRPRSLVPKPIQSSLIAHNHTVFVTSTGAIRFWLRSMTIKLRIA